MGRTGFQWKALFGGCLAQVEDVPSPNLSPERKKVNKQTLFTRLSHPDISKSTNPDDISSPEKKVNKQMSFTRMSYSDISKSTNPDDISSSVSNLQKFSLAELKVICQNFTTSNYLGEGGFGTVFKGLIDEKIKPGLKAQVVAVKVLDLEGMQGHKEWLMEVILLGQMTHPNLVKLIGYCYEEKHRVLVYEYMTRGSLENHLFKSYFSPLQWKTRVQIAVGAAKGLEFLHGANPQVIYRDFKPSNILLDSDYKAKLSDFGLAKDGPQGDDTHVSTRLMGTQGYAAPEYIMTGHLTARSDVYSFGVVLLELLTGKRSFDKKRSNREQSLVDWTKSSLNDPRRLSRIMDQSLEGQYSTKGAGKLAALAYQCLSHTPKHRPDMTTVVETLEPLLEDNDIPLGTFVFTVVEENAGKGREGSTDIVNKGKEENSVKTSSEESDGRSPSGENRQKHQQRRSHNHRHRTPSPKSANYTDMVHHRKSPRHRNPKGV